MLAVTVTSLSILPAVMDPEPHSRVAADFLFGNPDELFHDNVAVFFSAQLGICVETGMNNGRKRPIRLIMHEKRDNGSFEDPCQLGCPIRDAGRFPKQFKVLPRMGRILIVENSYKMFIF